MAVVFFLCVTIAASAIYRLLCQLHIELARRRLVASNGCLPCPSLPQRDPFFGVDNFLRMLSFVRGGRRNISLKAQLDAHGNTFSSRELSTNRIFTIEPQNLQAVLSTDLGSWGVAPLRRFVFEPLIGRGIMNSDGAAWESGRAMLKPLFGRQRQREIMGIDQLDKHVGRMLQLIPRDGSTIDMQPLLKRQALDVATEFLFGASTGALTDKPDPDAKMFLDAYAYALSGVGRRMCLPFWNIFTADQKWWSACATARRLVERYMEYHQVQSSNTAHNIGKGKNYQSSKEPTVLAAELLRSTTDKALVRDQLLNIFMPAHDADAIALTNIIFALARSPDVYVKLRQEVLAACPVRESITVDRLKALPYLQAVVRETMRLYPSIGTTSRAALADTILPVGGGPDHKAPVLVRKGDVLSTSFYALHRRKDIWGEDAELFKPERWEEAGKEGHTSAAMHWTFLPFSGGPRVCPGQGFAMTEVTYTMARILQTFSRIENRDPVHEFVEWYKVTTESRNGAKVAFLV